jgi:hypothetical protein
MTEHPTVDENEVVLWHHECIHVVATCSVQHQQGYITNTQPPCCCCAIKLRTALHKADRLMHGIVCKLFTATALLMHPDGAVSLH